MQETHELTREGHAEIGELLALGRKIEAIKRYRELTGQDLATSKAEVERLAASVQPELAAKSSKPINPPGCVVLCVAIGTGATALLMLGL